MDILLKFTYLDKNHELSLQVAFAKDDHGFLLGAKLITALITECTAAIGEGLVIEADKLKV